MGRVDPESVAATNVQGGTSTTVTVVFNGVMPPWQEDPVKYAGDTDALEDTPPNCCPWPAVQYGVSQTTFQVATKAVTSVKSVTVSIEGPSATKKATFTISP